MTVISTANTTEEVTPMDLGEGSVDLELKSFPPVTDAIDKVKSVDWELVRIRALIGVNYVGFALSVLGRGIYTLGEAMRKA